MTETILNAMWVNTRPTRGALICMEMCGSGPRTGTRMLIQFPVIDPTGRHHARFGSGGVVPGSHGGASLRSAGSHNTPSTRNDNIGFRVGFQFTGEYTADLNASVQMEMLWVEPGTFTMGGPTTESDRETDETKHNVTLTPRLLPRQVRGDPGAVRGGDDRSNG